MFSVSLPPPPSQILGRWFLVHVLLIVDLTIFYLKMEYDFINVFIRDHHTEIWCRKNMDAFLFTYLIFYILQSGEYLKISKKLNIPLLCCMWILKCDELLGGHVYLTNSTERLLLNTTVVLPVVKNLSPSYRTQISFPCSQQCTNFKALCNIS